MIFGTCPNCDANVSNALPSPSGVWAKIKCEECKKFYWLYHSRIQSFAITEEEFGRDYIIDRAKKTIQRKDGKHPLDDYPEAMELIKSLSQNTIV